MFQSKILFKVNLCCTFLLRVRRPDWCRSRLFSCFCITVLRSTEACKGGRTDKWEILLFDENDAPLLLRAAAEEQDHVFSTDMHTVYYRGNNSLPTTRGTCVCPVVTTGDRGK